MFDDLLWTEYNGGDKLMPAGSYCKRMPWGQQKPPLGYGVDWSSPLAQGLVGCWLFNEGAGSVANDLASDGKALSLGGVSWSPNVLRNTGLNSGMSQTPNANQKCVDMSFIWKGRITGGTPWNSPIFACATPKTSYTSPYRAFALQQQHGTTVNLQLTYNVAGTYKGVTWNNAIATNISAVYCCTFGLNSVIGYKNGVQSVSGTDRAGGPDYASDPGLVWSTGVANGNYTLECEHEYTILFNRALSPSEVAQLYEQPYAMIEGYNYGRSYSIPSSAFINSSYWYQNPILEAI